MVLRRFEALNVSRPFDDPEFCQLARETIDRLRADDVRQIEVKLLASRITGAASLFAWRVERTHHEHLLGVVGDLRMVGPAELIERVERFCQVESQMYRDSTPLPDLICVNVRDWIARRAGHILQARVSAAIEPAVAAEQERAVMEKALAEVIEDTRSYVLYMRAYFISAVTAHITHGVYPQLRESLAPVLSDLEALPGWHQQRQRPDPRALVFEAMEPLTDFDADIDRGGLPNALRRAAGLL